MQEGSKRPKILDGEIYVELPFRPTGMRFHHVTLVAKR